MSTMDSAVRDFTASVNNKINFMNKAFMSPYFDTTETNSMMSGLNLLNSANNTEGILRISYRFPAGTTVPNVPATEAAMNTVFNPVGGSITRSTANGTMVLSSVKDYTMVPQGGEYSLYEYTGTLYVPREARYTFGINSTSSTELYINRNKLVSYYGTRSFAADENTPLSSNETPELLQEGEYLFLVRFYQRSAVSSTAPQDQKLHILWKTDKADDTFKTIGCDALYYDPSLLQRTTPVESTFNENDFITNILDYRKFERYFGAATPSVIADFKSPTHLGKIRVANQARGSNTYEPFVCVSGGIAIPDGTLMTDGASNVRVNGDINYNDFLDYFGGLQNGNYISLLKTKMMDVRKLYNALQDEIYEEYKANPSTTVRVNTYEIVGGTKIPMKVPVADVLTTELMAKLDKVSPVERFVLRRLLLLIDLVCHAHISMLIFKRIYESVAASKVSCESAISDMLLHFMTRLKDLNVNYNRMFETAGDTDAVVAQNEIMTQLYNNIHQFNQNSERMQKLGIDYRKSKLSLKSNLKKMDAEDKVYSSGKKYALAFLILTIIIVATLVSYAILAKVNPRMKLIGAAAVAIFSFVSVLIIYLLKTKKMEGFDTIYQIQSLRDKLSASSTIQVIQDAYMNDLMAQISGYIQNTIHMALILQNSKTYNYINHNLQKEINYYSMTKEQVDNATVLAKSSGRMYTLESSNNLSRVNVYIALVIILTFAIVGYILSGDNKVLQYIVLGIAGFLLFMVALLYILDMERKVRTDGKKYYWGQPNELLEKL
jgi:hypothetical protein